MAKNTRKRYITRHEAIALHTEANKSDPFASRRMAMTLAKHPRETKDVAEEGARLTLNRLERTKRNGVADWVSPEQAVALNAIRNSMKPKRQYKRKASMSQYLNKADFEAARAAA